MALAIDCELTEEGEVLSARICWSLSAPRATGETPVLITLSAPGGEIPIRTSFYRDDLVDFAARIVAFGAAPRGALHIPGYEPVDHFMVHALGQGGPHVAMSGQFHAYLLYEEGQTPFAQAAETLGPFCLGITFQAFRTTGDALVVFDRALQQELSTTEQ